MAREEISILYRELVDSHFEFIAEGIHGIDEIYGQVQDKFSKLCDDDYLCSQNCKQGPDRPEWQHAVRRALQRLKIHAPEYINKGEYSKWVFVNSGVNQNGLPLVIDNDKSRRVKTVINRITRDTRLSSSLKVLYENKCQICQYAIPIPDDKNYSESHHIKPLGTPHEGPDSLSNILIVCPNHHTMLDYGSIKINIQDLYVIPEHEISLEYVEYHNREIFKG